MFYKQLCIYSVLIISGDGEDDGGDPFRVGFLEGLGRYAEGSSGSGYVVDQTKVLALEADVRSEGKRSAEINQPMAGREGGLRFRITDAEQIAVYGNVSLLGPEFAGDRMGQKFRLVIAAAPPPTPVQRDGDDQVHVLQFRIAQKGGSSQRTEEIIQVTLTAKLKRQNQFPQYALIGSDAEDVIDGGSAILTAVATTFDQ